jgi:uncharacterized membrane protein YesL
VISNLLTTLGVICVLVAVAALTNVWWALLLLGLVLCGAGYVSRPAVTPAALAAGRELAVVKDAA